MTVDMRHLNSQTTSSEEGSEEEKREFTYDHKYAGNDTFQLLSRVIRTVFTLVNPRLSFAHSDLLTNEESVIMTFDSFATTSRNTDIFTFIFNDRLDWIVRIYFSRTID